MHVFTGLMSLTSPNQQQCQGNPAVPSSCKSQLTISGDLHNAFGWCL